MRDLPSRGGPDSNRSRTPWGSPEGPLDPLRSRESPDRAAHLQAGHLVYSRPTLAPQAWRVGIHPNSGAEAKPGDWERVLALVKSPKVVALGETGMDRHWDFTPFTMQQDYFARHLALARQTGLPVVIHCREAEPDMLAMLEADFAQHGPLRGVMHSFSGDQTFADACIRMGLYLSFAGMVTYKNAQNLRDVAAQVPSDRLLVETDAPYLAPVPYRGKRNESAFIRHVADMLSESKVLPLAQIARETTANAQRMFKH